MQSNKLDYRFFDSSDMRFADLRKTFDVVFVSLRKEGIGVNPNHVAVISH